MDAPNHITNAQSDRELITIWMADKSRTTQVSFNPHSALQFLRQELHN